jgi:transcriptional regulator with XRE-family HTH domain
VQLSLPNLQVALDAAGLNQAELGRRLGWSEAKVSRLINGKTKGITMAMLRELEQELGCSAAFLLGIEDVPQSDLELDFLLRFRAASERERKAADAILPPLKP